MTVVSMKEYSNNSNFKVGDLFIDNYCDIWLLTWADSSDDPNNSNLILVSIRDGRYSENVIKTGQTVDQTINNGVSREYFYQHYVYTLRYIKEIKFEYTAE